MFSLVCPGRLCRSWEHRRFLSFSFPLSSLASLVRGVLTNKQGIYNRFFNQVWLLVGWPPFIWFPLRCPLADFFPFFSFMSFLSSCPVILTLFFSCTHIFDNEVWLIGCPGALGFLSIAITYLRLVLSSSHVFVFCPSCAHLCTFVSGA